MPKKKQNTLQATDVRQCANIKSRKHPDSRCPSSATQGEFCAKHSKNPVRFQTPSANPPETPKQPSQRQLDLQSHAAKKLWSWWSAQRGRLRFRTQGPVANIPSLAENKTDLYTMDQTENIPMLYRWSYADEKKHSWMFDVRSLSMMRTSEMCSEFYNPYTRELIPLKAATHFATRCAWLRERKYCLIHSPDSELTPEQLWHQRLLDMAMKYDMLGYHMNLSWFEELSIRDLAYFYCELFELWYYRLNLSAQIKNLVVPDWASQDDPLFKWIPFQLTTRTDKKWWQRTILTLLNKLVSSAKLKEHKTLGALYGMTAFAIVSPKVRHQYPYLVEMD
jgi:hypothetical protein